MPKITKSNDPVEIAYFRFGVIAPIIQGTFPDASEAAYYRRITADPITLPDGTVYKFSPDTLERWASHYRKNGMDGLMPKSRKDKGTSRVIDDDAADEISRYLDEYPHASGVAIHQHLIESGFIPAVVSVRAVQRFLKEQGMKTPREGSFRVRRAFEMDKFGKSWQADTAYLPSITVAGEKKSRKTFVIMIIDDHSRMIVGGGIFFNDNAMNFLAVLKRAVIAYGIPDVLYMDNGSSYSNGQLSFILGNLGILEKHAKVRDGASKGKVERNFRTLRSRWASTLDFAKITSLEQLDGMLQDYIDAHNRTFHTGINERPIDRYMNSRGYIRIPKSRGWLEESFYYRIIRKVRSDNVIKINTAEYDVPGQFTGMKVEVRYNPSAMEDAYIFYNGSRFPISMTDRVKNGSAGRDKDTLTLTYNALGGAE